VELLSRKETMSAMTALWTSSSRFFASSLWKLKQLMEGEGGREGGREGRMKTERGLSLSAVEGGRKKEREGEREVGGEEWRDSYVASFHRPTRRRLYSLALNTWTGTAWKKERYLREGGREGGQEMMR